MSVIVGDRAWIRRLGEKMKQATMKASVEKLRWVLAAGFLLLLFVVVGFLGYGRYKQARKWVETLRRLNVHGPHETRGFTYSSSPKDRTSYKVKADRVVQHGDGTWSLYNVDVLLYSKTNSDVDHIHASDIEYDQNTGVGRAVGEVQMDIQAPGALKNAKVAQDAKVAEGQSKGGNVIHMKASGVVYMRKLDVAATQEPVEFSYAGLECTARGAEFLAAESRLRLLADVVMTGTVEQEPITLRASQAMLDRSSNQVTLNHAMVESRGRTMATAHAVMSLRNDGSVEKALADGGVTVAEGTRRLTGADYAGTFNTKSLPVEGHLSGGVVVTDTNV
ncbi:MAG: hypothetical protein ABI142_10215, partial [Bryocella sp.]